MTNGCFDHLNYDTRTGTPSNTNTAGSRFTMGLHSRIFGCKSNRRKTSNI